MSQQQPQAAAPATVSPVHGIRAPQQLILDVNIVENWKLFKQKWRNYSIIAQLNRQPADYQVALLLHTLGDDALRVYNGFDFQTPDEERTVDEVLDRFDQFAIGEVNESYERFVFNNRGQNEGETFENFHTAIRSLIRTCNYCDNCVESILRDRIVVGVRDADTQTTLLKERKLTLQRAIDICKSAENASTRGRALRPDTVHKVEPSYQHRPRKYNPGKGNQPTRSADKEHDTERKCKFCGRTHPMKKELCPAWGQSCKSCNEKNHFALRCPNRDRRKVHNVFVDGPVSSEEEWINAIDTKDSKQLKCKMLIGETNVIFQVDTGASINTLPEKYATDIKPTNRSLQMWNLTTSKPLGTCRLSLRNPKNKKKYSVEFIVVRDEHTPLLGLNAAEKMGLVKVMDKNLDRVAIVQTQSGVYPDEQSLVKKFPTVFDSKIGTLPGVARLRVKDDSIPTIMPDRRTPIAMRDKLSGELKRLEEVGVITKVEGPTPWVSQVVIAHKKSGDLRICIDPQELNKALIRERFTLPILEEKLHELGQSRLFTMADLSSGYWHVELDEQSSLLTTFQTCHGRYRWLRLPFGTSVSAEIFQRKLLEALDGLPGIVCIADDVIIHGKDEEQHDHHLTLFLQRCSERGIKLNENKLVLKKSEVTFMGHRVTCDGLQSDPEKIRAITHMKEPKDVPELRRFLGCINYLAKFLPNLSETLSPLLNLLKKDVGWNWSSTQQDAFDKAKLLVTSTPVLTFYDPGKELLLENDASEYGLGSALYQNGKPIAFSSRSLTETETRYAQIEKEMLAVCHGLTKFHHYTYGRDVRVLTDHKPLVSIKKKPLSKAPRRIQNLLLRTQDYSYSLEYKEGKNIPVADTLSRAPLHEVPQSEVINHIFYTPIKTDRLQQIKLATLADDTLTQLKAIITKGWPNSKDEVPPTVLPYFSYRDELTVQDGIVLRGERVVIPLSMRGDIKDKVHAGHLGINSCLRRARELVFWPGMSSEIRQYIESCGVCATYCDRQPAEPLVLNKVPNRPFSTVASDIFTIEGHDYLVTVDCYSTFIEVDRLTNLTTEEVIVKLKHHFARYGIPDTLLSDNGTQYTSAKFRQFSKDWNFFHQTSSPGNSQSNGAAEAAVKVAKRMMRRCQALKEDPYIGLLNLRNTPTEGLSTSPAQRLMGRRTRTVVPTSSEALRPSMPADESTGLRAKKMMSAEKHTNRQELAPLRAGENVRVQPIRPGDKVWKEATVAHHIDGKSYKVVTKDGRQYRRSRKHLRAKTPSTHTIPPTNNLIDHTVSNPSAPADRQESSAPMAQATQDNCVPHTNEAPVVQPDATSNTSGYTTKAGRVVKPPARYSH